MNPDRDTRTLADFQENTPEFPRRLKESGDPVVLTVDGKAEVVVQDAASYQKVLDLLDEARVVEGIRRGLEDVDAGRTMSLDEFKEHARKEHGISA